LVFLFLSRDLCCFPFLFILKFIFHFAMNYLSKLYDKLPAQQSKSRSDTWAMVQAKRKHAAYQTSMAAKKRFQRRVRYAGGLNKEIKYTDINFTSVASKKYTGPPTAVVMPIPVQGAAPYNRIGSKILNKSLRLRGFISVGSSTTAGQDILRVLVVYDRQTNGAAPSWGDVCEGTSAAGAANSAALAPINMGNRDRFVTLMDWVVYPGCNTAGSITDSAIPLTASNQPDGQQSFILDRYIKLKNLETHFGANTGGVGDIRTGGIFMFFVNQNQGADGVHYLNYNARLRFDDM